MGKAKVLSARAQVLDLGWVFEWKHDELPYQTDMPDDKPTEVLVCLLRDDEGMVRGSVGGIGDPDDAFAREMEESIAHEALAERASYCVPLACGLQSSERAVSARIGRLMTALDDEITGYVVKGAILDDVVSLKHRLLTRLRAAGWALSYNDVRQRWTVTAPPLKRQRRRA